MRRLQFWDHVLAWDDPEARPVTRQVVVFLGYALLVQVVNEVTNRYFPHWGDWGLEVAPYEVAGVTLSALLVLRTNAGNDRWWEARKLWGAITNQSRNLAILVIANGPDDPEWRREILGWIVAYGHACRRSLRNQKVAPELIPLIGSDQAQRVSESQHLPSTIGLKIAGLLKDARDRDLLDRFAYLQAETQRGLLIDHIGGCERINKTPLPIAYVILIRRFIVLFLVVLPWALMPRVGWFTPLFMLLITYPILALDRIGEDLQKPFSIRSINHLPLDEITTGIEQTVFGLIPPAPTRSFTDESR